MEAREKMNAKVEEMKEKYADVINDLCCKYDKTTDIGFDMLVAIARADFSGLQPEYETDLELDRVQLLADYEEYLLLAEEVIKQA